MIDEGYIKFQLEWQKAPGLLPSETEEIIEYRQKCFHAGFIGVYKDSGIGFGNISQRHGKNNSFIISGTQTGNLTEVTSDHFALVMSVDFEKNIVQCIGPVAASAESLTHAVFYELDQQINCVIHIHHLKMWERLKDKFPTTGQNVPSGTVAMVNEVKRLYRESNLPGVKLMIMAGHKEGMVSFGKNFDEAFQPLIDLDK